MRTSIAMQMCLFDGDRVTAITTPCAHRPPSTPRTGNRKCPHIRFGPRQLLSSHFVQQVLRVNAVRHAVCPTILIHICVCGHVCVCVCQYVGACALVRACLLGLHARAHTHARSSALRHGMLVWWWHASHRSHTETRSNDATALRRPIVCDADYKKMFVRLYYLIIYLHTHTKYIGYGM